MIIVVELIKNENRLPYEKLRVLVQYVKTTMDTLIFMGIDSESFLTEVVQATIRLRDKCALYIYANPYRLRDHQVQFCRENNLNILNKCPQKFDAILHSDGTLTGSIRGIVTETGITGEID